MAAGTVTQGDYFGIDDIESIVNSCPKRKSCGSDGVFYEDLKQIFLDYGHTFVNVLNVMLLNQRVSSLWKCCIIQRIPKKSFVELICQHLGIFLFCQHVINIVKSFVWQDHYLHNERNCVLAKSLFEPER